LHFSLGLHFGFGGGVLLHSSLGGAFGSGGGHCWGSSLGAQPSCTTVLSSAEIAKAIKIDKNTNFLTRKPH
jgi:hypothetical protein